MKTLETLYQEILASDELKKALAEAAQSPETLETWVKAQGCEATVDEIEAFLKEKQEKTGELSDDELESAAGGCNKEEAILSAISLGFSCLFLAVESSKDTTWVKGEDGTLLCHE